MIESNFEYTENLINKINSNAVKKYNLAIEIAMFIILLSAVLMFIVATVALGVIFSVVFVLLGVSLFFNYKAINKSNRVLVGQNVNIVFNQKNMLMTTKLGNKTLYKANFEYNTIRKVEEKNDLVFLYFDKVTVIVIPKISFKTTEQYKKALDLVANNYVV